MPVAGLVRLRRHYFGRETTFGTKVPAKRAYPFKGTPSVNLNWTDPDVDAGSIDPTAAPIRTASDVTAPLTDNGLEYNTVPLLLSGFFGASVDGTGTDAITYVYEPASTTVDDLDAFTYEFGDDVTDDWFQLGDGFLDSFEITAPEGLGALTTSMSWRFGSASSTGSTDSPVTGTVPTPGLTLDTEGVKVYLNDMGIAIASSVAGLTTGAITDALHSFTMRFAGDIDQKRWANGDQSFDVDQFVRATRSIELEATFSKTDDIVGTGSEADAWFSDSAVTRFVQLTFESLELADTGPDVPYSWVMTFPMRYYTRAEGESGGNSTVVLTGHAFFEPDDLEAVFTSTVICTLPAADL